jgi:hypothetical protein
MSQSRQPIQPARPKPLLVADADAEVQVQKARVRAGRALVEVQSPLEALAGEVANAQPRTAATV